MNKMFARSVLVAAIALAAAGCSSDSDKDHDNDNVSPPVDDGGATPGDGGATSGETISGIAEAPGGVVAVFEQKNVFEIALEFVVSPVAAAVLGLDPIAGATVELIRVDNNGNQVGDVLATTTTSINGSYSLDLPTGVNLSGDLILRISGQHDNEMRAQVVEKEININPVSEFILDSFIDSGADLDNLVLDSVVKLKGDVEEFDLTANPGADLTALLNQLDKELGGFVDNEIEVISVAPGNVANIAGSYRNAAISFGIHDSEEGNSGSFAVDMWNAELDFSDGGQGKVDASLISEEDVYGRIGFLKSDNHLLGSLFYETSIEDSDTFSGQLNDNGVLSFSSGVNEDVEDDYGWRWPPHTSRFQKALNSNVFFNLSEEAAVRYGTVNVNGVNALNPDDKHGDEVLRSFEILVKSPENMSQADLDGKFGRVYLGADLSQSGYFAIETEANELEFFGSDTMNVGEAVRDVLERELEGTTTYIEETKDTIRPDDTDDLSDELGEFIGEDSLAVSPTGQLGGEGEYGFINAKYDFFVFNDHEVDESSDANSPDGTNFSRTLAVKLPETQIDISENRYKVMFVGIGLDDQEIKITNTRPSKEILFNAAGNLTGVLTGTDSEIVVSNPTAQIEVNSAAEEGGKSIAYTLGATGSMTVTIADTDGPEFEMEGYMSHDGSIGVFRTTWDADGSGTTEEPSELGLAVLVQVKN